MSRTTGCLHRRRAIRAGEGSIFFVVRSRHLLIQISQEDWSRMYTTTMSQKQLLTPPPATPPNQTILGIVLAVYQFKTKSFPTNPFEKYMEHCFWCRSGKNMPEKREHQPEYQAFLGEKGKERSEKGRERTHISSPLAPQEGLILRLREHLKKQPCIPGRKFSNEKKKQFQALAAVFR